MIGVVLNPNALGVRRDKDLARRLREVLGDSGEVITTQSPDELGAAVDRFTERKVDVIATCGGDGTNLSTLTKLVERLGEDHLPRFVILRGGTVNTVAANLGVRGRPDEILARLVAARRSGAYIQEIGQDLLVVNGMYGFLFAAAMGARFIEAYYSGPMHGVPWATALAARTIGSSLIQGSFARWLFEPIRVDLRLDGAPAQSTRARLLLASVVPSVGIGMKVTWQGGKVPGSFHLVASELSTPTMALQLHRVLGGKPLLGRPHLDRLVKTAELRFPESQSYTLDGELFRTNLVTLRIGPRLRILKP